MFLKGLQRVFSFSRNSKDNRMFWPVQVDKHGNVAMTSPGLGFIKGKCLQATQVELSHCLVNVIADDPPQPLIIDLQKTSSSQHRHVPGQNQGCLLEKEGKLASFSGPGRLDTFDAMLGAANPQEPGR